MRKSLLTLPALITVLIALLAIGFAQAAQAAPLQVAVGVAPVKYFAQRIGGNLVQATVLVPAGADAHTYEPKPSQMRAVAGAALYLSVGLEFEEAWLGRIKAANPKLVVVRTDQGLSRLPMPEGHDDHGHGDRAQAAKGKDQHGHLAKPDSRHNTKHEAGHDGETDPHVWVAPSQARHIAASIAAAFSKADAAHASVYAANLAAFLREVDALDAQLRATFSALPTSQRGFLVFHPAWGYLAKDYGLIQHAIEFEGKEPSPKRLGAIITEAKAKGFKVIFIQPQASRRTAETIAKAIGARLVVADPLAEDWLANLRGVAESFRNALK